MQIRVFGDIQIEIDDSDYNIISTLGNGLVPASYEGLLKGSGITPETSTRESITKTVLMLVKDEVEMLKVLNPLWEAGKV